MNNLYPSELTNKEAYLISEKYIESDNSKIKALSRKLRTTNDYETVKNIYNYVTKNITYIGYVKPDMGAVETLEKKEADCDGYIPLHCTLSCFWDTC